VREHLEPVLASGSGELAAQLPVPLPARVLCAFLNVPERTSSFSLDGDAVTTAGLESGYDRLPIRIT
jgi:hypothetical protein